MSRGLLSARGLVIAAALLLAAVIGLNFLLSKSASTQHVRIGLILPLSGQAASYGELMRRGALMAQEDLVAEAAGKVPTLTVLIEDSRSTPTDGLSAYRKLVDVDKSAAVLPAMSSVVTALLPQADKDKILLLNCPATSPQIRDAGPFVFSTMPLSDQESKVAAQHVVRDIKAKRAAIVYLNDASGQGFKENFEKALTGTGAQVVVSEGHALGTTDFNLLAQRILRAEADVVYFPTYAAEAGLFLRQLRAAGAKMPVVSYSSIEDPKFLELAGDAAQGAIYTRPIDPSGDASAVSAFSSRYEAKYGSKPEIWTTQFYDCVRLLARTAEAGARTSKDLVAKLEAGVAFVGLRGAIQFDADGIVKRKIELRQVNAGKFVPLAGAAGE